MNMVLKEAIELSLKKLNIQANEFVIEHPSDTTHGDYSTNVAMSVAKSIGSNPKEVAEKIKAELENSSIDIVEKIEIAGPGFINFFLKKDFFKKKIIEILNNDDFGNNENLKGKKIILEYTDPNPFKLFHIGHMMTNVMGESFARITEAQGADVKRANWQGDIGLHVACAVWGMIKHRQAFPHETDSLVDKVTFLGHSYAYGATQMKEDEEVKKEIQEINKKLFNYVDEDISSNEKDHEIGLYYDKGREWSLDYFETMYEKLGTKFDLYFFESKESKRGKETVLKHVEDGIFKESEGAFVYKGEKKGLHTRVFINSFGLPTYEAKELGLAEAKYEKFKYDESYIITAKEIDEYFKVLVEVMKEVFPNLGEKTHHISHGLMKLSSGKMSSRTGDVVTAEDMIEDVTENVLEKMKDREFSSHDEKLKTAEIISIAGIKYSILKQSPGKDIIFDKEKALSFEGDSGPYIQYTAVRANSIVEKAKASGIKIDQDMPDDWEVTEVERLLYQFPEIVERAYVERAPQIVVTFVTELASVFNSFYANNQIVDSNDKNSGYKVALTEAVRIVLTKGLDLVAIKVPKKM